MGLRDVSLKRRIGRKFFRRDAVLPKNAKFDLGTCSHVSIFDQLKVIRELHVFGNTVKIKITFSAIQLEAKIKD